MTNLWAIFLTYLRIPVIRNGLALLLIAGPLTGVVWNWMYLPAKADFASARSEMVDRASARSELELRQSMTDRVDELSAQIADLEQKLAAATDRSGLVERLTALSAEAGTRIIHGANSFGTERAGLKPVLQDLTVEGNYNELRAFLDAVDKLETLTMMVSADISANPDGTLVRGRFRFMTLSTGAT